MSSAHITGHIDFWPVKHTVPYTAGYIGSAAITLHYMHATSCLVPGLLTVHTAFILRNTLSVHTASTYDT
jgi:hypothetical protein